MTSSFALVQVTAFIWTSGINEEEGIHVHAFRENTGMPALDETYGRVTIDGVKLNASMVRTLMAQSALPSLTNRVLPIDCPSCHKAQFDVGDLAFTPSGTSSRSSVTSRRTATWMSGRW